MSSWNWRRDPTCTWWSWACGHSFVYVLFMVFDFQPKSESFTLVYLTTAFIITGSVSYLFWVLTKRLLLILWSPHSHRDQVSRGTALADIIQELGLGICGTIIQVKPVLSQSGVCLKSQRHRFLSGTKSVVARLRAIRIRCGLSYLSVRLECKEFYLPS